VSHEKQNLSQRLDFRKQA